MKILINNLSLFETLRPFNDLGFVPTMGAIHKGHLSLINKSNQLCKKTIVSIFVNPKQFNNKKDYKNYPKNIKIGDFFRDSNKSLYVKCKINSIKILKSEPSVKKLILKNNKKLCVV